MGRCRCRDVVKRGHSHSQPSEYFAVKVGAMAVAIFARVSKDGLSRYIVHARKECASRRGLETRGVDRSDAASTLVVALRIIGSVAGFGILAQIAACACPVFRL
jgi:divalent metal cation (Fe/Co/Zn/Cd) transporter